MKFTAVKFIIFLVEWSNIDQTQFDRNNFGSDSTIDSQATVCPVPSAQNDDDQGLLVKTSCEIQKLFSFWRFPSWKKANSRYNS